MTRVDAVGRRSSSVEQAEVLSTCHLHRKMYLSLEVAAALGKTAPEGSRWCREHFVRSDERFWGI